MKPITIAWAVLVIASTAVGLMPKMVVTNVTRPVHQCVDRKPKRIRFGNIESFNFSEIRMPATKTPGRGFMVSQWWGQQHIFEYSIVSMAGKDRNKEFIWQCLDHCLETQMCASFVVTDSKTSGEQMGLAHCYFYTRPITKQRLQPQLLLAEFTILKAYNLVCPELVASYLHLVMDEEDKEDVKDSRVGLKPGNRPSEHEQSEAEVAEISSELDAMREKHKNDEDNVEDLYGPDPTEKPEPSMPRESPPI